MGIDTVKRMESGRATGTDKLVRVLRVLGLLEALNRVIPKAPPSPLERLALEGRERQRVRHRHAQPSHPTGRWTWGGEEPPGKAN